VGLTKSIPPLEWFDVYPIHLSTTPQLSL
jgi:hypothetical protein